MYDSEENFINEAKRLLKLIDEQTLKQKEFLFVKSIEAKVEAGSFISQKQIYWLRDIKDRQLEEE